MNIEPMSQMPADSLARLTMHRRFDRFGRLVGDEAVQKLRNSHVMIIGTGGVGSWAAESLVRSGVGRISLVDFDDVCVTNTNRQLPALSNTIGKKKVAILSERLSKINPQGIFIGIEKFYNSETSNELLEIKPDLVLDCIDNITAKVHLITECMRRQIRVITSGGAGSRLDPLAIRVSDLFETHTDQFLQQVRKELRQNLRAEGRETQANSGAAASEASTSYFHLPETAGIPCVFSTETPIEPYDLEYDRGQGFKCVCPQGQNDFHSCKRRNVIHGTASFVTGTFGLVMASESIKTLLR